MAPRLKRHATYCFAFKLGVPKLSCFTDMSFVLSVLDTPRQCCLVESLHNYKWYSNRLLFNFQDSSWIWIYADIFCGLQMVQWLILRTPFLLFIDSRRNLLAIRREGMKHQRQEFFHRIWCVSENIDNELGPCSPIIMWNLGVAC